MKHLLDFQADLQRRVLDAWAGGARNVMPVSATGTGKTVICSSILTHLDRPAVAIAHRGELTAQMSLALADNGVRHRIIGPDALRRDIIKQHIDQIGRDYTLARSDVAVAGVDTLLNHDKADPWLQRVGAAMIDEGHHVLVDNKWGRAFSLFPNALGLFPTATPCRADGRGLGRHADGLVDALIEGPPMREQIRRGFLLDYRIVGLPCPVDLSRVDIGASGEYVQKQLSDAVREQIGKITSDTVTQYLRWASGKQGVVFAVDLEESDAIARALVAAGVRAVALSGKSSAQYRADCLRRYRRGELDLIVNADLFGEGTDLPNVEVVIMARPTASWPLYVQQFGRALRLLIAPELRARWHLMTDDERRAHIAASAKPHGIIIDQVGNYLRHGLPDAPRVFSLDRREKRSRGAPTDVIPTRACLNPQCLAVYERVHVACPYCGHVPEPAERSAPELVDGDLYELDAATMAALRGEIDRIDAAPRIPQSLDAVARRAVALRHGERQAAQRELRAAIALWAGYQRHLGRDDRETLRRFYFMFGIDVATAQTLGAQDAGTLLDKINARLAIDRVVSSA